MMKKKFILCLVLCSAGLGARAADIISAVIAVTNSAGTTNGQTLSVNSDTRTWTNNVFLPASQILTNSAIGGAATNLYNAVTVTRFTGLSLARSGTNGITLQTAPGGSLSVTLSAGWGSVVLSTNSTSPTVGVRVPYGAEAAAQQTNITSGIAAMVNANQNTNALSETAPAMANLAGLTKAQTITGATIISNASDIYYLGKISNSAAISGNIAGVTNGYWWNGALAGLPVSTNLVNYGLPFYSVGDTSTDENYGSGSEAGGGGSLAVGRNSTALFGASMAIGPGATAGAYSSIAIGNSSTAQNTNDIAIGITATAAGTNSIAIGRNATVTAGHTNSAAIGYGAATTAANQIMLGSAGISVRVNNALSVGAGATFANGVTNLQTSGTNTFGGAIATPRFALSSLGNGINQDIVVGDNCFVEVSGPTGAFSIEGIAGGYDGKRVIILNQTAQNMTIATEGGATGNDPTAANRIVSLSGADRATTGNGAATLIYSGASSRWILVSFEP
jgi:hypothetical protein